MLHLTAALICLFAAFVQGFSGFGSALLTVPLLTLVTDIHNAVPISIFVNFFFGPYLTWVNRRSIDYGTALPMVAGGVFGVPIGVMTLKNMDGHAASAVLGMAIVTLIIVQNVFRLQIIGQPKPWKASIVGVMAGILAGAFNTAGPPVVAYLHMTSSPKQARATMYFVFLMTGVCSLVGHLIQGMADINTLKVALVAGPCAFVGAHFGGRLAEKMCPLLFKKIVTCLLISLGVYLVVKFWI